MSEKANLSAQSGTGPDIEAVNKTTSPPGYEDVTLEKGTDAYNRAGAIEAEQQELSMTVIETVKAYPAATFWAFIMSCTIIMEAYCVFLMGNFVAIDRFKNRFGEFSERENGFIITTPWQSGLQMTGPVGAFIGVMIAGPITSKIGYRWATIGGLMALNGFIFVFFFADSLAVMLVSQLLEGIPWGIFIANAPAYCSEIVPMRLRAPCTQMLQMFWAIGAIIVQAVTYQYNEVDADIAYKIPIALQWMFPTPLALLVWWGPESPWWLTRKGRLEEAEKAVKRLGRASSTDNPAATVAMMKRTIDLEKTTTEPSLMELFKGTDRYRTLIVCAVYAAQNLTGNLIANQAVFFFRQAGISSNLAFGLGLVVSGAQTIMVMASWVLTTYLGRRTIYLWGSAINMIFLIAVGIAGSFGKSDASSLATASLGLIVSVLFCLGPAPASWVIIGETSSIRLRPLTTGVGRASYYIVNIPCIYLSSWMLNTEGADLAGRTGYVWAATAFVCLAAAYVWLPEMKHRSYREIDILFNRHVPARKWKNTTIDIHDDE
ncbi:hypothetical protein MCOR27_001786 [Pyricularia oryzae]|uniref:Major facilitator superfamily (MFS) profile domain-containing protein n=5 Tax=Pyricularia TaxID=48558 RepID=A0ABQ8N836_PYRGI|nr:maltose permease MAL61 [Pyricularia oryzae 70-15]ELQ42289.1 general alpha-glucoside permease [Pyricularia oryzae Y34]KAH8841448.1 hypothetical protein MCOR01_008113 [Pyricularia oryzae]KAI6292802.1 hypothetical protein MCOR33_009570 [Pyricularia grisea]EHA49515.1 maltose permease MAL61 [Pyricularia oryzae 70-15]KAH9433208.1 hypothetical protein MCOR02_005264 [Pyricularia oryzae]